VGVGGENESVARDAVGGGLATTDNLAAVEVFDGVVIARLGSGWLSAKKRERHENGTRHQPPKDSGAASNADVTIHGVRFICSTFDLYSLSRRAVA
jgi:hypothetical protein